jgi:hypothetical protein
MIVNEEEFTAEKRNGIFKFIFPDLEAHNKSLEWIESERKRIGAEIGNLTENYDKNKKCTIYVNGRESGINYRITLSCVQRIGDMLCRRINEIELNNKNLKSISSTFQRLIYFETHWYDHREERWEYICLDPKFSENHPSWPGDHIVSVMNCLSEDMTSVLDKNMRTLRTAMTNALVISWFQGNTSMKMSFDKISQYREWLVDLDKTDSEFSFANKRDLILKNVKDNWGYWEELQKTTQMRLDENVFSNLEDFQ